MLFCSNVASSLPSAVIPFKSLVFVSLLIVTSFPGVCFAENESRFQHRHKHRYRHQPSHFGEEASAKINTQTRNWRSERRSNQNYPEENTRKGRGEIIRYENYGSAAASNVGQFGGNLFLETSDRTSYEIVTIVSFFNMIINCIRPDDFTPWQLRVPRFLWELQLVLLSAVASLLSYNSHSNSNINIIPTLLLALMLGSTAMTDLFLWAPVHAVLSLMKGPIDLLVSVQCVVVGMFYMVSAAMAWGSFVTMREKQKMERQMRAMELYERGMQQQQQ